MSVYDQIRETAAEQPQPQVWAATIAVGAATVTDTVRVTIPGFSADFQFGPCRWMPRVTPASPSDNTAHVLLPVRGDHALVAFDDNDDVWVLAWSPA